MPKYSRFVPCQQPFSAAECFIRIVHVFAHLGSTPAGIKDVCGTTCFRTTWLFLCKRMLSPTRTRRKVLEGKTRETRGAKSRLCARHLRHTSRRRRKRVDVSHVHSPNVFHLICRSRVRFWFTAFVQMVFFFQIQHHSKTLPQVQMTKQVK